MRNGQGKAKADGKEIVRHRVTGVLAIVKVHRVVRATVPRAKADPVMESHESLGRVKVGRVKAGHVKAGRAKADLVKVDHVKVDRVKVDHVKVDHVKVDHVMVDHAKVDHVMVDHAKVGRAKADLVKADLVKVDHVMVDHVMVGRGTVGHHGINLSICRLQIPKCSSCICRTARWNTSASDWRNARERPLAKRRRSSSRS